MKVEELLPRHVLRSPAAKSVKRLTLALLATYGTSNLSELRKVSTEDLMRPILHGQKPVED